MTQTVALVPTAAVPESYVRAAGQGHEAAWAGAGGIPAGLKGPNGIFLAGGNRKVIFSGFTPSSPVT